MKERAVDISVVIVNYNAAGQLKRCLASIAENTNGLNIETIVVDNASSDDSARMVATYFPYVHVVQNIENHGYTQANNDGIRIALGEYIFILNNDTEIVPGCFEHMIEYARAHPEAGAIAPQLLNPDLTSQGNVKSFPTAASALFGRKSLLTRLFPRNRYSRRYLVYLDHDMSTPFEADYASTAGLLVRKVVLDRVGVFDTDFFCYWSDADLCHRIKNAGWKIVCEPAAKVIHYEGNGGTGTVRRSVLSVVDFNRGAYLYYRKNRLAHPWSPMRLVAFTGLALNAVRQLVWNRYRVFVSERLGHLLNPAGSPRAESAIRALSAGAALAVAVAIILGTQQASAWLFKSPREQAAAGPGEASLAYSETPPTTPDIDWLEAEVSDDETAATAVLPRGDTAPVYSGDTPQTPAAKDPVRPPMRDVRAIAPASQTFGMVTRILDPGDATLDAKIEILRELGVKSVSMDFRWPLIEPENDRWEFASYDTAISKLDAAGIDLVPILAFTAPWASSAPGDATADEVINYPPRKLADYEDFVATVADRYADSITYWQLGLEPDLYKFWRPAPDPAAFVAQFESGAAAIRNSDSLAKVVYPGLTTADKLTYLKETLELGVAESADVFSLHDYENAPEGTFPHETALFVSLVERYAQKPKETWCKEIGWSTYVDSPNTSDDFIEGVDEVTQRDNVVKRWLIARDLPLERTYTWELDDSGTDAYQLLHNFGITRADLTPKAAYFGVQATLPLVDGATTPANSLVSVRPSSDTLEVHAFETSSGALVVGLWDRTGAAGRVEVCVSGDDRTSPQRVDLGGGAPAPVAHTRGTEGLVMPRVEIGASPTVLVFERPALFTVWDSFSPDGDGIADTALIGFRLAAAADETTTVEVLDAGGAVVRSLIASESLTPGDHETKWDGRDALGRVVADASYTVRLRTAGSVYENAVAVDTLAAAVTNVKSAFNFWLPPEKKRPYAFVPLSYSLSEPAHVTVDVFDAAGEFCVQLSSHRLQAAGTNALDWPVAVNEHTDGWYWYRVTARDAAGNVVSRESASPVLVDFHGPVLEQVSCSPVSFTPNTDGIDDVTTLRYRVSEVADIVVAVRDSRGRRFYLYAVRGQRPGEYTYRWNGRAYDPLSRSLYGLPDGMYTLELAAYDANGNASMAEAPVAIAGGDFAGPCVAGLTMTPSSLSVGPAGTDDLGWITFILNERADVVFTATSSDGGSYVVAALTGLEPGQHAVPWDVMVPSPDGGKAFLASGPYRLCATATDPGGNVGTAGVDFSVTSPGPGPNPIDAVSVSPTVVSPNSDGWADVAVMTFELIRRADVIVFLRDESGQRYDLYAKAGLSPGEHRFEWGGTGHLRTTGRQVALGNGVYELGVEAVDTVGNVHRHTGWLTVEGALRPLAVTGAAFEPVIQDYNAPYQEARQLRISYGLTCPADVVISLRSMTGRRYFIAAFEQQSARIHSFEWDGTVHDPVTGNRTRISDGTYTYIIEAVSGPSPAASATGRINIDLAGPR